MNRRRCQTFLICVTNRGLIINITKWTSHNKLTYTSLLMSKVEIDKHCFVLDCLL